MIASSVIYLKGKLFHRLKVLSFIIVWEDLSVYEGQLEELKIKMFQSKNLFLSCQIPFYNMHKLFYRMERIGSVPFLEEMLVNCWKNLRTQMIVRKATEDEDHQWIPIMKDHPMMLGGDHETADVDHLCLKMKWHPQRDKEVKMAVRGRDHRGILK